MVTFPDATALLITHLAANLVEDVLPRVPDPRPTSFVTVRRTGGPRRNLVTDSAQVTVESWGSSDEEAHDLAQDVRALIHELPGQMVDGVPFYRVDEFSGPANLPDPVSDQPRYSQTFSVALRGA